MNADGSYDKHKVRVVVKGFLARLGLAFYSTFAPTTMLATARIVMAAAVHHRVPVRHADVPQAFLQAQNNRPIYIDLPKGIGVKSHILEAFREHHPRGKACFRLIKSLYGLASAPMIFSKALSKFLIDLGMSRARVDSTLFSWQDPVSKKWTVVTTFVDDLLITGTDEAFETHLRKRLIERFGEGFTWADNVKSFLGLRIHAMTISLNSRSMPSSRSNSF